MSPQLITPDGIEHSITQGERATRLCVPYMTAEGDWLNLGCGKSPIAGWINLDRVGGYGADIVRTLGVDTIPLKDASCSCVFASHVLEHIPNILHAMREIHRVLIPGGVLVACTPYASSDGAWDDPTHVRAFTEHSWMFYDRRTHETPGNAGYYPSECDFIFDILRVDLIPELEYVAAINAGTLTEVEFRRKVRTERNTILELQAHLRKVEG